MRRVLSTLVAVLVFLSLMALRVAAQPAAGSLSGFVVDESNQPLVAAVVKAVGSSTPQERTAATDSQGYYRITGLPPAEYTVQASAPGFAPNPKAKVRIHVGVAARLDLRLSLEPRHEEVLVTTRVEALPTETATLGVVLTRDDLQRLPLNRRDFLQLALLAPGVASPVEDSELSSRGAFAIHANGAREDFNNFVLDGGDNNDPYVNRFVAQPPLDSIQEFQIATATYSAEHSRNAGAQIQVVTRRGGAEWHGFAYEYLRNRIFDARNFFDGATKPRYQRHQYGGGIGGPLRANRTFVFASVDSLQERQGWSRQVTVPLLPHREGDFRGSAKPVVDPYTRAPFADNRIPASRISPAATGIVNLFPLPGGDAQAGNLLAQPVGRALQPQGSIRFDEHVGDRDQVLGRYSVGAANLQEPFTEDPDVVPGFGNDVMDWWHQFTVTHQRAVSASRTHALRVSFGLLDRDIRPEGAKSAAVDALGLPWLATSGFDRGLPRFNVSGYSSLGDATSLPITRRARTLQIAETVSVAAGAHLVKAGGEYRRSELTSRIGLLTRGSLSFSGALSGYGLSDLLLGLPSFGLRSQADNPMHLRGDAWQGFLQDDWRVSPRLSLHLGMRYEYASPPVDPANRFTLFDPGAGQLIAAGTNGYSRSGLQPDRNNVAPRVALAWQAPGGWVLRTGYGLYYDSGSLLVNTSNYFNPPQFTLRVYFPSAAGLISLSDPFPTQGGMTPPASLNAISPDFQAASVQHWSFSLQRPWGAEGFVLVSYTGSKGSHLLRARDLNQPPPAPGPVQLRRPLPQFGNILFAESGANSSYQSLQASAQQRFQKAGSLWVAYTWSKSIDSASAFLATRGDRNFPQQSARADLERGLSSFDLPHRLVAAWVLPLPGDSIWTRNTEIRGIVTAESGRPFTPSLRFDNSNTGNTGGNFGSDRPQLLGDPRLDAPTPAQWFDTSLLPVAAPFAFGNAGRNILRGGGVLNTDLSLSREFSLTERQRLQVEAQAFNLWNRTAFHLPGAWADEAATFGRVFSARAPRQFQFAIRWRF